MRRRAAALVVIALPAAACSHTGAPPQAAGAPAATAPATCPAPGAAATGWPAAVPATLPKPPGARIERTEKVGAATYVYFTTPTSLRDSTLYLVRALRTAGFTLARGDAEATEADAPFVGPTVVGAIRLTLTAGCLTTWTLAVVPRAASAPSTLIPYSPRASASALPFG